MSTATVKPAAVDTGARGAFQPIGEYGLLADCNSAALVSRDGSIDWLCLPRYDSDAIFARILDPDGGHWSIRPAGEFTVERRYVPGSLVVETTFTTAGGVVRLRGAKAFGGPNRIEVASSVPLELRDAALDARFVVREGQRVGLAMVWAAPERRTPPTPTAPDEVAARVDDVVEAWRSWEAEHDVYRGPHRELV